MLTFRQLYDSSMKLAKWRKHPLDVDGKLVDIIPNLASGIITFRFRIKSSSNKNEGYNTWLQFYGIQFSDTPQSSNSVKIIRKDTGKPLYFEKISLTNASKKNFVRVRCGCKDFEFRFAWEDLAKDALYGGRPRSYTRKPGSNRPEVNPEHYPGICKHLYWAARSLESYFTR